MKNILIFAFLASLPLQAQEILNFEFMLPTKLEKWYGANYGQTNKSEIWKIADVFSSTSKDGKKIGYLGAYFDPQISNFRLSYYSSENDQIQELEDVKDWGYGIRLNVKDKTDDFVRIYDGFFNQESWLNFSSHQSAYHHIVGFVSSYVDALVYMNAPKGQCIITDEIVELESGIYYVKSYRNGEYIIREEIHEDMPCWETEEAPTDMNTLIFYRIKASDLDLGNGKYNIETAYPKGC